MRTSLKLTLALFLLFFFKSSFAYVIEGKIVDESGSGIPYVTVLVENSTYGTYSLVNGSFTLRLDAGSYTLSFHSIGYSEFKKSISVTNDIKNLRIVLNAESQTIGEVVVGSDKASMTRRIIEGAKAFRKLNNSNLTSTKSEAYSKYSLTYGGLTDTLADSSDNRDPELVEKHSTVFYVAPNKHKELIKAFRDYQYTAKGLPQGRSFSVNATLPGSRSNAYGDQQSFTQLGNSYVFVIDKQTANFNLYQNRLNLPDLSENPYISPIGNSNFLVYDYLLVNSYFEEDTKIYTIKVTPKNSSSNAFYGTLLIEDSTYALVGANLSVNEASMQFHTHFSFNHQYGKVEESIVLNTEEYSYHTKIGKDDFAYGTSLVLYSNTTVNEEISSKFMRQGSVVYADSAQGKGQDYWNKIRPKNLNTKEINFIKDQDSIRDYEHSSAYIEKLDSITNHNDIWSVLLSGVNFYNREKGTSYYFHSLLQTVRPFAVGGYRHAVAGNFSKTWTKENRLTLGYEVNYGFRNKNIKGALSIDYLYNPKKFGSFSIRGGDNFAILNEYESIQGTFSRGNYLQKYFYGIGAAYELANGLMIDANLDYATFRSIENIELAPWSETIFGAFNVPKEFNGYNQLVLDVELTLIPYQKYQLTQYKKELLGSDWPTFNIRYKKGIKPFGESNVNYDFVQLNVNKVVSLNSFGDSKFEINTGQFFNDREIRIADQKFFRGSDRYFYSDPLRSFQFLSPTFVTTNPFFQGHYLHQFNGALLNKVPFIKRFRLQTLAGTSILLLADDNFRHTEAYVGLAKPFRIKKQLFKLNTVYVVSSNSDTGYREGFKVGIAFFDSFTKSWNY